MYELAVILLLIFANFQDSKPPQKVINALKLKFPSAENIKWFKIGDKTNDLKLYNIGNKSDWEANFILRGKKATSSFKPNGKWFESTLEISGKELNEVVKSSVLANYPKCEILSAIITEWQSFTWYMVRIKCDNEIIEKSYDYQGMPYPPKI